LFCIHFNWSNWFVRIVKVLLNPFKR
jgi:hypothetical protein